MFSRTQVALEEKKNNKKPITKTNNKTTNNKIRKSEDKSTKSNPPRGAKNHEKRNPEPVHKPRTRKPLLVKAKEVQQLKFAQNIDVVVNGKNNLLKWK